MLNTTISNRLNAGAIPIQMISTPDPASHVLRTITASGENKAALLVSTKKESAVLHGTPPFRGGALMSLASLTSTPDAAASERFAAATISQTVDPTPARPSRTNTEACTTTSAPSLVRPACIPASAEARVLDDPHTTLDHRQLIAPEMVSVLSHRLIDTTKDAEFVEALCNCAPLEKALHRPFLCQPAPFTVVKFEFRPPCEDFRGVLESAVIAVVEHHDQCRAWLTGIGFDFVHESGAYGLYCKRSVVKFRRVAASESLALVHVNIRLSANDQQARSMHFCMCTSGWNTDHRLHMLYQRKDACTCRDCIVLNQIRLLGDSPILIIGDISDMRTCFGDLQYIDSTSDDEDKRACHSRSISVAAVLRAELVDPTRVVAVAKYTIVMPYN